MAMENHENSYKCAHLHDLYRTTANDLEFTFAMQCVLRKPTTLLHLGFDDDLTAMILMILCTKWWWWLQIVLFFDMDVELGDLFLMASRPGMEELLQSVKA
jgi:hypothetical protein